MAEENKLNQTPEITPAPSAEAPEKAPTTGELLGDVEHYDEEKDDWSTGYYGTGSRQQVTDDVFHKLETGEEFTRDDFIKAELALQDAKLDSFGVGENLITSKNEPVFGGVYKLVAIENDCGELVPKIKLSETAQKITTPGFKEVYRFYGRDNGKALADYIVLAGEEVDDTKPLTIFDPNDIWKKKTLTNFRAEKLQVPIFKKGVQCYISPTLEEIRSYCAEQMDTLWDEVKRFEYPHTYYVDLSQKLWDTKQRLMEEMNEQ